MRIDLALKYLCLAKSRSSVKSLCDNDTLLLNGHSTKPSHVLRRGDRITIDRPRGVSTTIEIVEVPDKQLSKSAAREYYRVVDD